jgi:RNA polymerase sigma factor (sigma-70 family)
MRLLRLAPDRVNYDDLFLALYARLRVRALALTGHDYGLAEDLLHDAFIQFTLARPALDGIADLEAYLGGMLRHMHASHIRRAARRGVTATPLDELEFLAGNMQALAATEAREELALLCRYACLRKETSKAGSILILRFLHGFFPAEIARIARLSAGNVDVWLRLARKEARLFRDDPDRLRLRVPPVRADEDDRRGGVAVTDPEILLRSLRETVFNSRQGPCLSRAALRREYLSPTTQHAISTPQLAHVASCSDCLPRVAALLGLPSLAGRFPDDPPASSRRGPGASDAAARPHEGLRRERRRRNVVEHRPKELRIAVNGIELACFTVGQRTARHSLSINLSEPIAFVEVFSGDGVRLLFAPIEPFPAGAVEQSTRIALSEDRQLDVVVQFADPWPAMQVVYRDPHWSPHALDEEPEPATPNVVTSATPWTHAWTMWMTAKVTQWRAVRVMSRRRFVLATAFALIAFLLAYGDAPAVWAAVQDAGWRVLRALGVVRVVDPPKPPPPISRLPSSTGPARAPEPLASSVTSAAASERVLVGLEIDVLHRLDRIGALLGQEAVVSRRGGRIVVQAYGADAQRREAIAGAVRAVRGPAHQGRVLLLLTPPAARHAGAVTPPAAAHAVDASVSIYPLQPAVERTLMANGIVDASDRAAVTREARHVALRAMKLGRGVLLNAGVLRDVALRFTSQDAGQMDEQTRTAWRLIVRDHARDIEQAIDTLEEMLAPWLPQAADESDAHAENRQKIDAQGDAERDAAVERVFALAQTIDEVVREAFAAGPARPVIPRLSTSAFRATLTDARAMARTVQTNDHMQ